jgi:hypothetical protein
MSTAIGLVTLGARPHTIVTVPGLLPPTVLTKRRAVDFCRVATAICRQAFRIPAQPAT